MQPCPPSASRFPTPWQRIYSSYSISQCPSFAFRQSMDRSAFQGFSSELAGWDFPQPPAGGSQDAGSATPRESFYTYPAVSPFSRHQRHVNVTPPTDPSDRTAPSASRNHGRHAGRSSERCLPLSRTLLLSLSSFWSGVARIPRHRRWRGRRTGF